MIPLFFFIFGSVGLTSILVTSKAGDWLRSKIEWKLYHSMTTCHQCCGFWIGLILSPLLYSIVIDTMPKPAYGIDILIVELAAGGTASLLSSLYASLAGYLQLQDYLQITERR